MGGAMKRALGGLALAVVGVVVVARLASTGGDEGSSGAHASEGVEEVDGGAPGESRLVQGTAAPLEREAVAPSDGGPLPPTRLVGRIVDTDGAAHGSELVKLVVEFDSGLEGMRWTPTDDEGAFVVEPFEELPDLSEATGLRVDAGVLGRVRTRGELPLPPDGGLAGLERDVGLLVVDTGRWLLGGRVVGVDGEPIHGAAVEEANPPMDQFPIKVKTDEDGRFRLRGWNASTNVSAYVEMRGYVPTWTGSHAVGTEGVLVVLGQPATISGSLLLANEVTADHVWVKLKPDDGMLQAHESGAFEFSGLGEGDYTIEVLTSPGLVSVFETESIRVEFGETIEIDPIDLRGVLARASVEVLPPPGEDLDSPRMILEADGATSMDPTNVEELCYLVDRPGAWVWSNRTRARRIELHPGHNLVELEAGIRADVRMAADLAPTGWRYAYVRATGLGVLEEPALDRAAFGEGFDLALEDPEVCFPLPGEYRVSLRLFAGDLPDDERIVLTKRVRVDDADRAPAIVFEESDRIE